MEEQDQPKREKRVYPKDDEKRHPLSSSVVFALSSIWLERRSSTLQGDTKDF